MADYNVHDLIDEVLDLSKDQTLPRTRILGYIQRTQDEVLGRHRFKFSEQSLVETLSTNSTTYEFDCDHQEIIQVVLSHADIGSPLQPTYLANVDFFDRFPSPDTDTAGQPGYYTDYGGDLYWDLPLDRGYTLAMRYIAAPCRLEDTTSCTPDIPSEFADILVKGALARVEAYRENFDHSAIYKREVEDLSEDLLLRYGLRKLQPGKVRTTRRQVSAW